MEVASGPVLPFGINGIEDHCPTVVLRWELSTSSARMVRSLTTPAPFYLLPAFWRAFQALFWCLHSLDLFAPALARTGLHPGRIILCETYEETEISACDGRRTVHARRRWGGG